MGLKYKEFQALLFFQWFPKRKSTVVGIIASGLGLAALVFVPIQKAIINPDNLKDLDEYVFFYFSL